MSVRGELTGSIKAKMEAFLGRPVMRSELRLLPYLGYCLVNERRLDPNKVDSSERDVLRAYRDAGYLTGGASYDSLRVTREFWDFMQGIIYEAYSAYDAEEVA